MDNLTATRKPTIADDDERCRFAEMAANPLIARIAKLEDRVAELEVQLRGARRHLDKYERATFELSSRLESHGLPGDYG